VTRDDDDDLKRVVVREKPREDTFKVVVAIVVVLLLLNFGIIVYFVHPAFNPPDDDGDVKEPEDQGDWLLPVDRETVSERDVRYNMDGPLDRPFLIEDGGDLVIWDSHIQVYLQDLMFWLRPAFDVEAGGGLFILNSTVEIYREPMLDKVIFGPYMRPDHNIPYIARTVNLDEAVDPVLHLDIQWLGEVTPVVVGVIPEGEEDLVLLDQVERTSSEPRGWTHGEVGLADYAGTRPWVVIWFNFIPTYPLLIGNLSVQDGGAWPPGDAFPTGHPLKDGWGANRFYNLPYIQRGVFPGFNFRGLERTWQPLINSVGEVSMTSTTIEAPPGIEHRTHSGIVKELFGPGGYLPIDKVGSRGGHIQASAGEMRFHNCTIMNVPVTGRNASVDGHNTTFSGEADLVTLYRPTSGFKGCTFITEDLPWDHRYLDSDHRYIWALGVEGAAPGDPMMVWECEFRNNLIAVEATRTNIALFDNHFQGIRGMAIWNHMSTGLGTWDQLSKDNDFGEGRRYTYMRTTVTEVEFVHPQLNASEIRIHSGIALTTSVDLTSPFAGYLQSFSGNLARYVIPESVVLGNGVVKETSWVKAKVLWVSNGYTDLSITPGTPSMVVDLAELYAPDPPETGIAAPMALYGFEKTDEEDVYQMALGIRDLSRFLVNEPTMRFSVNGETVLERNLTDDDVIGDSLIVWHNLSLPPGWRDVNVTVWGKEWLGGGMYSTELVLIDHLRIPLLMMSEDVEVEPWMPIEAQFVVVPENVTATIEGLHGDYMDEEWEDIVLIGWSGSRLSVDCTGLSGTATIRFELNMNMSLEVTNLTAMGLEIYTNYQDFDMDIVTGDIVLRDIDVMMMYLSSNWRNVTISNVVVSNYIYLDATYLTNVSIEDSEFRDAEVWIEAGYLSSLDIRNCTFDSVSSYGITFFVSNANITVEDCTIRDSALMFFLENWYDGSWAEINVTGCDFFGDEALLYVGWNILRVDSYDMDADFVAPVNGTIEGNTFSGPGAQVVLAHGLYGRLWGGNQLVDGARLNAFYITRLQVIPPDDTPINYAFNFIPVEGFTTDWPFQVNRWLELDGEILWDVTDDPSVENDPPILEVLLFSKWGTGRIVRGFDTVVPNADNDEGTYPPFPDFQEALRETLVYWPPLDPEE
jgi:hypothetical protein